MDANPFISTENRNSKAVAVIQARMGSSRLRGKSLASVNGIPLIKRVVDQFSSMDFIDEIIIATTDLEEDDPLDIYCRECLNCKVFRGHSQNVFSRFSQIAEKLSLEDNILRITADNMFYDQIICRDLIKIHTVNQYDYTGIKGLSHRAFEIISVSAFINNVFDKLTSYEEEHVTPYFINNPDIFKVNFMQPQKYGLSQVLDSKLTVDTEIDRNRIESLLVHFKANNLEINQANLYSWLTNNKNDEIRSES